MKHKRTSKTQLTHNARKLLRFLAKEKEHLSPLLILTHDYPDPDALGSAFALEYIAERVYGMTARIAYGGVIGRVENKAMVKTLKIPAHKLTPGDFKKFPHVALIDTQPAFENNPFPKHRKAAVVIDQHPFVEKPNAELAIIDEDCGATSAILGRCLLLLGGDIPVRLATALTYGIGSDTLNLYRCREPEVVQVYHALLSRSDLHKLAHIQNPERSRKFFVTLGVGIRQALIRRGLIVSHLAQVESPDLVSQVADFLLTYERRSWSLCTGRYKGKLYVSLRGNNPNAQAGEVLRDIFVHHGQAGGRGGVAGGSFPVGDDVEDDVWKNVERELTERLMKRLRISPKGDFFYPFRARTDMATL